MTEKLHHQSDLRHCGCCGSADIDRDPATAAGGIAGCRKCYAEAVWWSPPTEQSEWMTQDRAQLARERMQEMIDSADAHQWDRWGDSY
jgi:hypothetical protein